MSSCTETSKAIIYLSFSKIPGADPETQQELLSADIAFTKSDYGTLADGD
jgi:hypothetical protein